MAAAVSGRWPYVSSDEPVFCACESDLSSTLTVRCPGAPSAPQLRVENMDKKGIEVAWEMSEELADDDVSVCIRCIVYNFLCQCELLDFSQRISHACQCYVFVSKVSK